MTREISGELEGQGLRIGIVVSNFNDYITTRLLNGAIEGLTKHGVAEANIIVARVPGSFEIPLASKKLAESGKHDAIIAIGAVLKGETLHFDLVCSEAARGIAQVALMTGVPVLYGILSPYNMDQALERSGGKKGNRGYDCGLAAIQMVNLLRALQKEHRVKG